MHAISVMNTYLKLETHLC